mmetsp:Transcript_25574/g.40221  ORF Transcript_25574/g.40221 Transcript_25574/m.40221 type:complete len:114 (-) Transcript_25574:465-806(-)
MGHEIHSRFRADVTGNVGAVGNVGLMLDVDGGASADYYSVAESAYREAVAAEPLVPSAAEKEMIGKVVNLGPADASERGMLPQPRDFCAEAQTARDLELLGSESASPFRGERG